MLPIAVLKKFPAPFWLLVLLANTGIILAFAPYGIGLSVDSANYVSAARSLINHHELKMFDGAYLVNAPPLYPLLLSMAGLVLADILFGAAVINFLLLNASLLLAMQLLQQAQTKQTIWIFLLALLPYWAFEHAFTRALSEPLFIFLFLLSVTTLPKVNSAKALALGLIPAALCMTRYAGFFLFPGLLSVLLIRGNSISNILKYFFFPLVVSICWIYRNMALEGTVLGAHTFFDKYNLFYILFFLLSWVLITTLFIKHRSRILSPQHQVMLTLLMPVLSYLLLLFGQKELPLMQVPRFLSVVEFPLLMVLGIFLSVRTETGRIWFVITILLATLKAGLYLRKCDKLYSTGAGGYHSEEWQDKALIAAVQKLPSKNYCSNFPDIVYWVRTESCQYLPFTGESCEEFKQRAQNARDVIWFNNAGRNHVMQSEQQLEQCFSIMWYTEDTLVSVGKLLFP